jgi:hypothetical protein
MTSSTPQPNNNTFTSISVKRTDANTLTVTMPEDISADADAVVQDGEIPLEFAVAVLARGVVEKKLQQAAALESCTKDCYW